MALQTTKDQVKNKDAHKPASLMSRENKFKNKVAHKLASSTNKDTT